MQIAHMNSHIQTFMTTFIAMFTTIQPIVFKNSLIIMGRGEQFPLEQIIRADWKFEKDI